MLACTRSPPAPSRDAAVVDAVVDAADRVVPPLLDASAPPARPIEMRTLAAGEVPKDIVVAGKLAKAVGWSDANGDNVVVFAIRWLETMEDHDPLMNVFLTVEHAVYASPFDAGQARTKKVLAIVKDSRESCDDGAMKATFLDDALGVTDLDADGIGEVTFAYRIVCEGHHTPFTQRLFVLENGDKRSLRGTSRATYAADPAMRTSPVFLGHAEARWRALR